MDSHAYEEAASSTIPPVVHLDAVRPGVIFAALKDFVRVGENLNRLLKKPFVYGPTRTVEEDQHHPYVGAVDIDPPTRYMDPALAHGIIGVATESAELVELLIDTWFIRRPLDAVNVKEEIGDILWYLVRIARAGGVNTTLADAMAANAAKLANRHKREPGQTFNPDADKNRDLEAERALLEASHEGGPDLDSSPQGLLDAERVHSLFAPAEEKGISRMEHFDDGTEVWLESYAGGGAPEGAWSKLATITYPMGEGEGIVRRYTADDLMQPSLGLATNLEIGAELEARQRLGHTDPNYRSLDSLSKPERTVRERVERIGDVVVRRRIYGDGGKPVSAEEANALFEPKTIDL